ncbi:MAG: sulfatase-like hydrolase/transferase [Planctomycetes bacterium]|nr:sulfatase-like hydrolase/transferase [Planctomycetota bacterium]
MPKSPRPNILIYMSDHQRGDTVLPGHPCITPNVSRLAADGILFDGAYCPSPHCCPSRATFHTGLYPSGHGVWNNVLNSQKLSDGLLPGVRTFSQDLAESGYRMLFSGKWHVSAVENPADRGWEELALCGVRGNHHGRYWQDYAAHVDSLEPVDRQEAGILRPGYGHYTLYGTGDGGNRTDENSVASALAVLPELARSGNPWCMFVGVTGPHDPYVVPQRFLDMYDIEDVPLPPSAADEMTDKPAVYRRLHDQVFGQLTEREVRQAVRHFRAYCTYLDSLFGTLVSKLDETCGPDDTLVIYCSDHGDYCGDHRLFAKGIPAFRGAYHVPMVMRWPKGFSAPGRRVSEFVSLADIAPTLLDVAGVRPRRRFTGRSLVPFFEDATPDDWPDAVFTQCNGVELYYTQRSVMTRDYKYVFNGFDFDELYDLRSDPHEMVNLIDRPGMEDVKRSLCKRLWRFARSENDSAINPYITVGLAPYGPALAFED